MKKYLLGLLTLPILVGCSINRQVIKKTHNVGGYFADGEFVMPMNTISSFTTYYEDDYDNLLKEFDDILFEESKLLDRYHSYEGMNNLYTLNNEGYVSNCNDILYMCIKDSYNLTKLTDGKFNLFMGRIIDLFSDSLDKSDASLMPSKEDIEKEVSLIPTIEELDNVIVFNDEDRSILINKYKNVTPSISIGGIGKGFIGDHLSSYILNKEYPCIVNLGSSSISLLNKNPSTRDGSYSIAFRLPLLDGSLQSTVTCAFPYNLYLSTSGDYENCYTYEDDTKLMHHIINPYTGYSNNTFRSVSLASLDTSMAVLDALSTAVFNCDNELEAIELINKVSSYYNSTIDYMLLKPVYVDGKIDFEQFAVTYSRLFEETKKTDFNSLIR